jgi:hypothetical protein
MTQVPTEAEFRTTGFTIEAAKYPLSRRAFEWLCHFNGVSKYDVPLTWQYAPNLYMQKYLDDRAVDEGFA